MTYNFPEIRKHYEYLTPLILERGKQFIRAWINPYSEIDWPSTFSPIEMSTWMAIRSFGKAPLYPQYPVDKYFVDFGNPLTKVAIECDGKEWHLDKEKDLKRDKVLYDLGWVIYRISGSDIYKIVDDEYYEMNNTDLYDDSERAAIYAEYYRYTIEGLINAISIFHFDYPTFYNANEILKAYECLVKRVSIKSYIPKLDFKRGRIMYTVED